MPLLTIFTPTYNRAHTLVRTFHSLLRQTCRDFEWMIIDDGSADGTRDMVRSWGDVVESSSRLVDWMGRTDDSASGETFCVDVRTESDSQLHITYIYKENGGLYTGYNAAYANITTELCVCIDSDDYMPDDAVQKIVTLWKEKGCDKFCGIIGLDYNVRTEEPIGGRFSINGREITYGRDVYQYQLSHIGDTKYVFRTNLMKVVAPMTGFEGEKDFNPHYMQIQVLDKYSILVLNENLCWVEYQIGADSMSQEIWKQYIRSPRSYAKYRLMEMQMKHGMTMKRRFMLHVHYVSSCILFHNRQWLHDSPNVFLSLLMAPLAVLLFLFIKYHKK